MKILVLEDEELFAMLLHDVFTEAGFRVVSARDGDEALQEGEALRPDLFFTDWRFAGRTSSVQVAEHLRGLNPDLKVVLLTGMMGREASDAAAAIGAFRLLVKPSSIDDILMAAQEAAAALCPSETE